MCGIFGIINKKDSKFDSVTFNLLGFHNDSRGGDSCGIFIDGKVEYGTDKLKLYQNFYLQSELLKQTKTCQIALGHCRKASVGGVSPEKAQPVVIYDSEDEKKINFVLIHNGTISNYTELAKEYIPNIDTKHMTDSQILANIIYNCGTDVFGEYVGAGVFVFVDYRKETPETYIFKGESKEYYSAVNSTEERPLCFVSNENKFIFSSLPNYLAALQPNLTVYNVPTNKLMIVRDCKLFTIKEYDRKEKNRSGYTPSKSIALQQSRWNFEDDEYGEYFSEQAYGYKEKQKTWQERQESKQAQQEVNSMFTDDKGNTVILADRIQCDDEFMFRHKNRQLCHSRVIVDSAGYIRPANSFGSIELWFFNGVLLYNKECYKELMKQKINEKKPLFDFMEDNIILINAFSPLPFTISDEFSSNKEYYKSTDGQSFDYFTGQIPKLFSSNLDCYDEGKFTGSVYLKEGEAFEKLKTLLSNDNESNK